MPMFSRKGRSTKELEQSWAKKTLREKMRKNLGLRESVQFHTKVKRATHVNVFIEFTTRR